MSTASNADGSPPTAGRRKYLVLFVALAVFAVAGIVVAGQSSPNSVAGGTDISHLPVGPPPPALTDAKSWLNSPPLTPTDLQGKVVVYDFWTYSCVNCVRTLPYLRSWYDRYRQDGLVVVGIHSPEFDFEKDHSNVASAVKRLNVDYPVALDDDMAIWNQFGAMYWPQQWVADRQGHLRYQDIGEGQYSTTEDVLRKLLGIPTSAPRAKVVSSSDLGQPPQQPQGVTQETYLGLDHGTARAQPGLVTYPDPGALRSGDARLVGPWLASGQRVQATAPGAAVVLSYRARDVNLVMAGATGQPVDVTVELDGKPLPSTDRTTQTMVDAQGTTFVRVSGSDLYRLVLGPSIEDHTLRLTARAPGVQAFAFTFGA
ncbi:MAG TPA: redoxin domain-containing protein [Acidimicrobiia bacterium]|nr:redoxin domain-containing protein [Acidimicrobiia bacterium]